MQGDGSLKQSGGEERDGGDRGTEGRDREGSGWSVSLPKIESADPAPGPSLGDTIELDK